MARIVVWLLVPLLLSGCVASEALCEPYGEAHVSYAGEIDPEALAFALREAGWTDAAPTPIGGLHARWAGSGPTIEVLVLEERTPAGIVTLLHAWGGAGIADADAAQRLLAPFVEPTLLYLEPHAGRPASLDYVVTTCG